MSHETFTNEGTTTLGVAINSSYTILTVADGGVFPMVPFGSYPKQTFRIKVDDEIMVVVGRSDETSYYVERGQEGTTADSHEVGANVSLVLTAGSMLNAVSGIDTAAKALKLFRWREAYHGQTAFYGESFYTPNLYLPYPNCTAMVTVHVVTREVAFSNMAIARHQFGVTSDGTDSYTIHAANGQTTHVGSGTITTNGFGSYYVVGWESAFGNVAEVGIFLDVECLYTADSPLGGSS